MEAVTEFTTKVTTTLPHHPSAPSRQCRNVLESKTILSVPGYGRFPDLAKLPTTTAWGGIGVGLGRLDVQRHLLKARDAVAGQ